MELFIVMGNHQWNRSEYLEDAFQAWLKDLYYNVNHGPAIFRIENVPEGHETDVYVDAMGGICYPQGSKVSEVKFVWTESTERLVNNIARAYEALDDTQWMLNEHITENVERYRTESP